MRGCFWGLVWIAVIGFGLMVIGNVVSNSGTPASMAGGGVSAVTSECKSRLDDMNAYVTKATKLGFLKVRGDRYQVDEAAWSQLTHDQKVNVGIAAFCQIMKSDGSGVLLLRGLHDGKTKASVVDGNYLD